MSSTHFLETKLISIFNEHHKMVIVSVCMCTHVCMCNEIFIWIRDKDDDISNSRSTCINLYINGRSKRGRGVCTLAILQCIIISFWGMLASPSFMRRIHPSRGNFACWHSWFIIGIMLGRHSKLILMCGTNPHRRTFNSLLGYRLEGRIFRSSPIF